MPPVRHIFLMLAVVVVLLVIFVNIFFSKTEVPWMQFLVIGTPARIEPEPQPQDAKPAYRPRSVRSAATTTAATTTDRFIGPSAPPSFNGPTADPPRY